MEIVEGLGRLTVARIVSLCPRSCSSSVVILATLARSVSTSASSSSLSSSRCRAVGGSSGGMGGEVTVMKMTCL